MNSRSGRKIGMKTINAEGSGLDYTSSGTSQVGHRGSAGRQLELILLCVDPDTWKTFPEPSGNLEHTAKTRALQTDDPFSTPSIHMSSRRVDPPYLVWEHPRNRWLSSACTFDGVAAKLQEQMPRPGADPIGRDRMYNGAQQEQCGWKRVDQP